jgi:enoyl-CoA hydratase/carnithine racemase
MQVYRDYRTLAVSVAAGVATVTINHPPINLFDLAMMEDMVRLGPELAADTAVRVIVFQSADPEFFIAHADVEFIESIPPDLTDRPERPSFFHQMLETFRLMPKVTIGKIEGRARGGGSELLLAFDMRFAAIGRALMAQPEVAIGIIPGAGGCVRLPRLIGRGRALEVILGCEDFDAETAERYGYVNRALPAADIGPFVDRLARRIATFPAHAIGAAKAAVDASASLPINEALLEEQYRFNLTLGNPETRERMRRFMANGGQTRAVEMGRLPLEH